tara:strand:- start:635 stop:1435 length:801 start_codon:yes stop_codon:yes gene_type:complete
MKVYILILLAFNFNYLIAQKSLDTIYVNDQKNVALFFPKSIRQGITGKDNFVFTYNKEKAQYFGLLQGQPGKESNLLAITSDGRVYSYILKYKEQLTILNYFISKEKSIGNENPSIFEFPEKSVAKDTVVNRTNYFKKFSDYLLRQSYTPIATGRKSGIKFQLEKVFYNASEVYVVIEVKNNSGIDFEMDYLNIYRENGNNKRKASYQRLEQDVIYKHEMPDAIKDQHSKRFVYVLPKFVLGDNEKLLLEIKELKGSRKVVLETRI